MTIEQINTIKKWIYVTIWTIISLVSSYNTILDCDFSFIKKGDFYREIIAPLLIWALAFFADYIFTISTINEEKEELDKRWTQKSYISIGLIFFILLLGIYYNNVWYIRTIWIIALFYNIISLKVASLNIVRPVVKIKPL